MEWASWTIGAVIGALVGVLVQNIAFPSTSQWIEARRKRRFFVAANRSWNVVEHAQPGVQLVQAGWGPDGCFPAGSVTLHLTSDFRLRHQPLMTMRNGHARLWLADQQSNDEQVGISTISVVRTSDLPDDDQHGQNHQLRLTMHTYRWFDFLATHKLWHEGDDAERATLATVVGLPDLNTAIDGFPNPCSVGLSLFCEGGDVLALPRRSTKPASGGHHQPGKIYNSVGENFTTRDFSVALDGSRQSTVEAAARRGLYEEAGFVPFDIDSCAIRIHSFAWSSVLLDHKFFGMAITRLSRAEVQDRWRNAPDRAEFKGSTLRFEPVRTRADCTDLLRTIRDHPGEWAPEATFSTIRSLLTLQRIRPTDLTTLFRSADNGGSNRWQVIRHGYPALTRLVTKLTTK